jgi:ABC-2 type transport system permease protein
MKLWASFYKELLILIRDRAGLAILFIMPALLIIIMALIQHGPFRDYQESNIPVLFVDNDHGILAQAIEQGLRASKVFTIHQSADLGSAEKAVANGEYKIAIAIGQGTSEALKRGVEVRVDQTLAGLGLIPESDEATSEPVQIQLIIDPAVKKSFKSALLGVLYQFIAQVESQTIMETFADGLSQGSEQENKIEFDDAQLIFIEEVYASKSGNKDMVYANSVQHNVPAWTLFAMFFIVIPLAGNMLNERVQGTDQRLLIMPIGPAVIFGGKLLLFITVCLVQMLLMFAVGIYILPLLGLPVLSLGNNILALALVGLFAALSATCFGLLIGSVFETYQQATSFGAISVIILASIGGIWVPVYVMPEIMQQISSLSPLNWALNAFYDLFLRGGTIVSVMPEIVRLIIFSLITGGGAIVLSNYKRTR